MVREGKVEVDLGVLCGVLREVLDQPNTVHGVVKLIVLRNLFGYDFIQDLIEEIARGG